MAMPYIILTEEDLVRNIKSTSDDKPFGYKSWKDYWIKNTGQKWPKKCRIHGCTSSAFAGAHVNVKGYQEPFIIPLCRSCNSGYNSDIMSVNVRTAAVMIDEDEMARSQATFSHYEWETLVRLWYTLYNKSMNSYYN